jgi:hypothetical protein
MQGAILPSSNSFILSPVALRVERCYSEAKEL